MLKLFVTHPPTPQPSPNQVGLSMVAFIMTIFLQWRRKQIESVCVGWGELNLSENLDKQIKKKKQAIIMVYVQHCKNSGGGRGGPTPTCTSYFLFSLTFIANLTGSFQKYSNFLDTDSFPTQKNLTITNKTPLEVALSFLLKKVFSSKIKDQC